MSENLKPSSSEGELIGEEQTKTAVAGLSVDALARRRMLLKSLGKGSAMVAAVVPLQSLANSTALLTRNGLRCSVSGMQSGVHSKAPTSSVVCGGYSPGWWGQSDDGIVPRRPWPSGYPAMACTAKFTQTGYDDPGVNFVGKTLFKVMSDPGFSSTKTRHWICAFLNGFYQSANRFPYTGQEILDFYNLPPGNSNRAAAYTLITGYLETHAPV